MIRGAGEQRRGRADCEDRMEEGDIGTQGKGGREKSHQEEVPEEGLGRAYTGLSWKPTNTREGVLCRELAFLGKRTGKFLGIWVSLFR